MDVNPVFIVGSPRSGTTILGKVLNRHPQICEWFEPYFILDHHFRQAEDDVRVAADATPEVIKSLHVDFSTFKRLAGVDVIVDKSPRNSLKIPFLLKAFPNARFLHIVRDGRDAVISIRREWEKRGEMSRSAAPALERFEYVFKRWLGRQPFWRHRLRAIMHEIGPRPWDSSQYLHTLRWDGRKGWGPRFANWREALAAEPLLVFNAMQWASCVAGVHENWGMIAPENRLLIRYEDMCDNPQGTIQQVLDFVGVNSDQGFFDHMPPMYSNNYGKWKVDLMDEELKLVVPEIAPMLVAFGYEP